MLPPACTQRVRLPMIAAAAVVVGAITLVALRATPVNRPGFVGGLIPREDGPDAQTQQVCPRAA